MQVPSPHNPSASPNNNNSFYNAGSETPDSYPTQQVIMNPALRYFTALNAPTDVFIVQIYSDKYDIVLELR